MKVEIFFKEEHYCNGVARLVHTIDNVVNCFSDNGYLYIVSIDCYRRFKSSDLCCVDLVV